MSATTSVDADLDPLAEAAARRLATDRWFCWHQEDVEIGAVGTAAEVVSRGPGRARDLVEGCASVLAGADADLEGLPAGAGPLWVGGMAFAPDGAHDRHWSSFAPARLVLPELAMVRTAGRCHVTASAVVGNTGEADRALSRLRARLEHPAGARLPLRDPHPNAPSTVRSVRSPASYASAVGEAVRRIRAGRMEKVVLAREVRVEAPSAHDPAAVIATLRDAFPECYVFCVGTPEAAFVGASPELLVRRRGAGASTVALAGSARRSADPSVDDHLAEQLRRSAKDLSEHGIVVRRIARTLRPHAVWVGVEDDPTVVRVGPVQHLATPIHAQLAAAHGAIELAGILHPTPAVGGEPWPEAGTAIEELEAIDRGWYAAPVGWMDAAEDGEFCVALRSALLRDRTAHLYAGAGIVEASDPEEELAETELKLEALLPAVTG